MQNLLDQKWYYTIELEPGVFTPGRFGHPTSLVRELLNGVDVRRRRCLDIGAMEGLIATLLAKRGAAVTAIDVTAEHLPKVELVKKAHRVRFETIAPLNLEDAPRSLGRFDVVVFGGVLYHTIDVVRPLLIVRSLVNAGGLVFIESWLSARSEHAAYFNAQGIFTDEPNTYWFLTVPMLDSLLRFARLEPIACRYCMAEDRASMRLAVLCRAMPMSHATDPWTASALRGADCISMMSQAPPERAISPMSQEPSIILADYVATHKPVYFSEHEIALRLRDS